MTLLIFIVNLYRQNTLDSGVYNETQSRDYSFLESSNINNENFVINCPIVYVENQTFVGDAPGSPPDFAIDPTWLTQTPAWPGLTWPQGARAGRR
jgi:hypothetical protein